MKLPACLLLCAPFVAVIGALLPKHPALRETPANLTALSALPTSIDLKVPGTTTTITFSDYGHLLSQTELNLCVIEGLAQSFSVVLATKRDPFLLRNKFSQKYGEVQIEVRDWSQPSFRMTYAIVANMLRGVALFMSIHGYYEVTLGVFDTETGHVGAGTVTRVPKWGAIKAS